MIANLGWQLGKDLTFHIYRVCPLLKGHQYDKYKGHNVRLTTKLLSKLSLCRLCSNKETSNNFLRRQDAI